MTEMMEVCNLRYNYPGHGREVLRDLTIRIPKKKRTALCGHNGAGKSTLFMHMTGILQPEGGTVKWNGDPISYRNKDLQLLRRRIGLVFQDPEQQLIMNTPYEDITYGLRNAFLPEDEIRMRSNQLLKLLNLEELADVPIHRLSLGQKKRVALAGVMALEPELLLLDEPAAYLDPVSEKLLMNELNRIHAEGVTIVMATHDMNIAYAWADWLCVLHQGKCVMEGTPFEIFENAAYIKELGLETPMLLEAWNALPAVMREGKIPPRSLEEWKLAVG
ncbi:energy-coupling factor ABC transporter ATP-binding protein [Paenibacillus abyssi]|uniref:ABC transporter ATP-binding protein n=1 Tax=Paenibacillus abyssi TaxID=1340531 RepID=A0A917G4A3_9BACL|nr:ABC transporter ATP-binding protein [Paenibacillus abyssi]GGG22511.1 putative ABC transporter ATP-binding protein [Paenibacillus abyssi]